MYNYDLELIKKYVDGLDIEEDLDTLESDPLFMMDVINYTNDKNIYNICYDNIRGNYDFIVFLINKFKNDTDYICKVVDNYLKIEKDSIKKLDIMVKAYNLTKNKNENSENYKIALDRFYVQKRIEFEAYKIDQEEEEEYDPFTYEMGKGFLLFQDSCKYSEDLLDYFSNKCINEIIIYHNINFEVLLHEEYKSFLEVKKYGINNFIIDALKKYDRYLAAYIANHLYLLDNIKQKFTYIEKNWIDFELSLDERKYKLIWDVCFDYLSKDERLNYSPTIFIYFIGKELGIEENLKKYDTLNNDEFFDYFDAEYDDIKVSIEEIDKNEFEMLDLAAYNKVKKVMIEILNSKSPENLEILKEFDEYLESTKKNGKCKIFKINNN